MAKRLTPAKRKLAREYVKTGSLTEAALKAYNPKDRKNAARMGSNIAKEPLVQDLIRKEEERLQAARDKLITPERIAEKERELIFDAYKESGIPDYAVQQKALRDYKDDRYGKKGETQQHIHQHLTITEKLYEDLENGTLEA